MGNTSFLDDAVNTSVTKTALGPKICFDHTPAQIIQKQKHAKPKHGPTTPRHLKNVFAKPIKEVLDALTLPTFSKGPAEVHFLRDVLKDHFVFQKLEPKVLDKVVLAFQEHTVPAGTDLITQGSSATGKEDYFFILKLGAVDFIVNGKVVGSATHIGDAFGELALLYSAPRSATVQTTEETTVYRLHQHAFRHLLHVERKQTLEAKIALLQEAVPTFSHLRRTELKKLQSIMVPRPFSKDEVLCKRGDDAKGMIIIQTGEIKVFNIRVGGADYDEMILGPGQSGGEDAILQPDRKRVADAVALTDGLFFYISRQDLESVFQHQFAELVDARKGGKDWSVKLAMVPILRHSIVRGHIDEHAVDRLVDLMVTQEYAAGDAICSEGRLTDPALYFVTQGTVEISSLPSTEQKGDGNDDDELAMIQKGGFFGQEQFRVDAEAYNTYVQQTDPSKRPRTILEEYPTIIPVYTATVVSTEGCTCQVLYLRDCRRVIDTTKVGARIILGGRSCENVLEMEEKEEEVEHHLSLKDFERHRILGSGTFGQVWLVSYQQKAFALKIQSKYHLCDTGQARAVIRERNFMATLHHPFLVNLVDSFQDDKFVYMVMEFVQAGELHSVIHHKDSDDVRGLPEKDALFFAAGIQEGLAFLHSRASSGTLLVSMEMKAVYHGFQSASSYLFTAFLFANNPFPSSSAPPAATYVQDRTYTFCGTPYYMAPEVILNLGYDTGADHWRVWLPQPSDCDLRSHIVTIFRYELLVGHVPYITDTHDQRALFRSICEKPVQYPEGIMSDEAQLFLKGFLQHNPNRRLGWRSEDDIYHQPWLAAMDFKKLFQQEYKSPYQPDIQDTFDASHFHDWKVFDITTTEQFELTNFERKIFEDF
eukprot:scaffold437_cov159-Amphora_coffeaeformis.AAC.19